MFSVALFLVIEVLLGICFWTSLIVTLLIDLWYDNWLDKMSSQVEQVIHSGWQEVDYPLCFHMC